MRKHRKGNRDGIDRGFKRALPFCIATLVIIGGLFTWYITYTNMMRFNYSDMSHVWDKSFVEWTGKTVGISFDPSITSWEEYETFINACGKDINNNYLIFEREIETGAEVSETRYYDGEISENIESDIEMKCVETLYFDDVVLSRWVSQSGIYKTAVSGKTDDGILVCDGLEASKLVGNVSKLVNDISNIKSNLNIEEEKIVEADYLKIIGNILEAVINHDVSGERRTWIDKAPSFFTLDGKEAIERLGFDSEEVTIVKYMMAGKSECELEYKDRILVVLGSGESEHTVILRVNQFGAVYDTDII